MNLALLTVRASKTAVCGCLLVNCNWLALLHAGVLRFMFAQARHYAVLLSPIAAVAGGAVPAVASPGVTPTAYPHHRRHRWPAILITAASLVIGLASPAAAEPVPAPTAPPSEGGTPTLTTLRGNLAAAAEGYIQAENQLAASKGKQAALQDKLATAEADISRVKGSVASYAGEAYKTGRIGPIALMLQASSRDDFLGRAQAIDKMTQHDQARLQTLADAQAAAAQAKADIDTEVATQDAALAEMAKRKLAAEKALAAAGGTRSRSDIDPNGLPTANPAPRNSDGNFPSEGCSLDDPTTSGCVTGRTLHALTETQRLGFGWYVSCYRPGDQYEHPKGRACDFAAYEKGFVNSSAGGANKVYGDRLAAFYVKNAKALGVMYVVWYCQIWQYGSGWHRYNSAGSNCGDSPAGDHTNHVHLSVY